MVFTRARVRPRTGFRSSSSTEEDNQTIVSGRSLPRTGVDGCARARVANEPGARRAETRPTPTPARVLRWVFTSARWVLRRAVRSSRLFTHTSNRPHPGRKYPRGGAEHVSGASMNMVESVRRRRSRGNDDDDDDGTCGRDRCPRATDARARRSST